jgi:hypothetical protein
MAFKKGDMLVMSQHGVDILVQAIADESDNLVMIKQKGAVMPCPIGDLSSWDEWRVLVDPDNPIYVKPDGQTTKKKDEAKLFPTDKEAEAFRNGHTGIPYFVPKKLSEC